MARTTSEFEKKVIGTLLDPLLSPGQLSSRACAAMRGLVRQCPATSHRARRLASRAGRGLSRCLVLGFGVQLGPIKITMTESQIQVIKPMTAPSEP